MTRAPAPNAAPLSFSMQRNGQHMCRWDVPGRGRVTVVEFSTWPRKVPMSSNEPLIYSVWAHLMSKLDVIMPVEEHDNMTKAAARERAQNEARGIAEVLAILMKPFMENADHVVRCAVKAYKDPTFEVPGLAPYLWDPMKNYDGSDRVPVARPRSQAKPAVKPAARKSGGPSVDPSVVEGIKLAYAGGFSKDDLANLYGVSLAAIEEALG